MQIRGVQVSIGGTYVLMDDVVTALRGFAQSMEVSEAVAASAVHEAATWLQQGADQSALPSYESAVEAVGHSPITDAVRGGPEPPYGQEPLDESPDIGRVEIYPDPPEDPNPKWYARSVDTGGYILQVTSGSYDQEWVIQNAQERWPGKDIYLLRNAGEDSKWEEDRNRGVFPSKGPPVRRLFAGAGR